MTLKTKTCGICFSSFVPLRKELFCPDCLIKSHCFIEDDILAAEYLKDARKDIESTEKLLSTELSTDKLTREKL